MIITVRSVMARKLCSNWASVGSSRALLHSSRIRTGLREKTALGKVLEIISSSLFPGRKKSAFRDSGK